MDYRLWWAGIGLAAVLVMWGLRQIGRRKANAHWLAHGVLVEAEVLDCKLHTDRFAWTEVTYRYLPLGAGTPVTVTRQLDASHWAVEPRKDINQPLRRNRRGNLDGSAGVLWRDCGLNQVRPILPP